MGATGRPPPPFAGPFPAGITGGGGVAGPFICCAMASAPAQQSDKASKPGLKLCFFDNCRIEFNRMVSPPGVRHTSWFESIVPVYLADFAAQLLARTLIQMGVPMNPNARRIWFSRKRS